MVKRKLGTEIYISLFIIFEIIVCSIIEKSNIANLEWWHFLYTNLVTIFIYMFILLVKNRGRNIDYISKKISVPVATMSIFLTIMALITIIYPYFAEVSLAFRIWFFIIFILITSLVFIYIKQCIVNILQVKNLEEKYRNDMEKHEYYREILKEYSPAILSLIYNRKIKYSDTLVVTILDLKLNNYIDIEEKGIKILKKDEKNLLPNQKYLYEKIYNKKNRKNFVSFQDVSNIFSVSTFKQEWKNEIKKEAEEKKLCSSKIVIFDIIEKISVLSFFILIGILMFIAIGSEGIAIDDNNIDQVSYLVLAFIHCALIFCVNYLSRFKQRIFFVRTKEGVKLQCKMCGLKNYIKEYTQLKEKKLEELLLWENYLLYAIIFDIKGNLNNEAQKLYDKIVK